MHQLCLPSRKLRQSTAAVGVLHDGGACASTTGHRSVTLQIRCPLPFPLQSIVQHHQLLLIDRLSKARQLQSPTLHTALPHACAFHPVVSVQAATLQVWCGRGMHNNAGGACKSSSRPVHFWQAVAAVQVLTSWHATSGNQHCSIPSVACGMRHVSSTVSMVTYIAYRYSTGRTKPAPLPCRCSSWHQQSCRAY